jgi:predicted RNA-binding Zn-ribbon protein involved in translation (DUF1610 family)
LYESDAAGLIDEDLLDDVGTRLYLRCESIKKVQAIQLEGKVPCPSCGQTILRNAKVRRANEMVRCHSCGWALPWQEYWVTFRHQELAGDAAFIGPFMEDWRNARTTKAKMLAVDRVIHCWHNEERTKGGYGIGRPSGVNLIEGSRNQVISFLDELTFGSGVAADSGRYESWKTNLERVRAATSAYRRR